MRRHRPKYIAGLFIVFAAVFSVVLWPHVSLAAKLAFFAAGFGCGGSIARSVGSGSPETKA
jgi:hypothetical protein